MPSKDQPSHKLPRVRALAGEIGSFGIVPVLRVLAAGDTLFRQGAPAVGVFRLLRGGLRLVRATATGTEVTMHTVRPGELFAEASLFASRYHCDAIATSRSEVHWYPGDALRAQFQACPQMMWQFTAELAHRMQGLRGRLEVQQVRSAKERVLAYLSLNSDAEGQWTRPGTLKHLAQEIGLTHEALYRALAALEKEGRIARREMVIQLRDRG